MSYTGFFPTYGGGHVKSIIPIVEALRNEGFNIEVLSLTNSFIELKSKNVSYCVISDYVNLLSEAEKGRIVRLGTKAVNHSNVSNDYNSICYHGIGLSELCDDFGDDEGLLRFIEDGRRAFLPKRFALNTLKRVAPDFVFVTCGQRYELAFSFAAIELDIPVIRLIDLIGLPTSVDYKATVLVGNQFAKDSILNKSSTLNQVYVTGNPNFEFVGRETPKSESESMLVSYFSQPGINGRNTVLEVFSDLIESNSNLEFCYKPHPNENLDDLAMLNDFINIDKDGDANFIIHKSDLVITHFSSVGFQAINQNKKLLVFNLEHKKFPVNYHEMGCAKEVRSAESLRALLSSFEAGDLCFEKELQCYQIFQQPRDSVQRVVKVINSVLQGG